MVEAIAGIRRSSCSIIKGSYHSRLLTGKVEAFGAQENTELEIRLLAERMAVKTSNDREKKEKSALNLTFMESDPKAYSRSGFELRIRKGRRKKAYLYLLTN